MNIQQNYTANAILLISKYSDTLIVIKKINNQYVKSNNKPYAEQIPLTLDELHDIFDTSSAILGFYIQQ